MMACPTCDHTMEGIGYGMFQCPRCGTVLSANGSVTVSALVMRCRKLAEESAQGEWNVLKRLGILEAIYIPENRPYRPS
jgi:ribosomal protein L37AE/L43A